MALKMESLMWALVALVIMVLVGGQGILAAKAQQSGDAEAPTESAVQQADCSGALDELVVCNASIGASTPASECCDALRSLGPQCMCSVFLGPPIPGISRDQAFVLPRNCNLPRIRCSAPPSPSDSYAAAPVGDSSIGGSVFFLGAEDDEDEQQHAAGLAGDWPELNQGGY